MATLPPNVVQTRFDPKRLVVVFVALLVVVGCSRASERSLLERFFSASRLRDTTALRNIATVIFEPRERGTVATFEIVAVVKRREGDRELKDVTITAPVRLPTRETVHQTLVVTLEKIAGRWIVTGVRSPV